MELILLLIYMGVKREMVTRMQNVRSGRAALIHFSDIAAEITKLSADWFWRKQGQGATCVTVSGTVMACW